MKVSKDLLEKNKINTVHSQFRAGELQVLVLWLMVVYLQLFLRAQVTLTHLKHPVLTFYAISLCKELALYVAEEMKLVPLLFHHQVKNN